MKVTPYATAPHTGCLENWLLQLGTPNPQIPRSRPEGPQRAEVRQLSWPKSSDQTSFCVNCMGDGDLTLSWTDPWSP